MVALPVCFIYFKLESTFRHVKSDPQIVTPTSTKYGPRNLNFIYTIGCDGASDATWQLLQSTVLDYSFLKVGQRGALTRIISGCVDNVEKQKLMSQSLVPHISVKFFPSADQIEAGSGKKTYVQANRPTALRAYFNSAEIAAADPSTIYIVLDPDFVFRKRISDDVFDLVQIGSFLTQKYSLSNPSNYAYEACLEAFSMPPGNVTSAAKKKCEKIKDHRSFDKFYGGVPYILLRNDWLKLLDYWIPLIGPVLQRYPGIESDMISWAIAAAGSGLTGNFRKDFMATCMSSHHVAVEVLSNQFFLHLCQSYYVGETRDEHYRVNPKHELPYITSGSWNPGETHIYVFNKHWLKRSHLLDSCNTPLLILPPPLSEKSASVPYKWHHFVATEAVQAYNDAVVAFRKKYLSCSSGNQRDASRGLVLHEIHRNRYNGGWNHAIDL